MVLYRNVSQVGATSLWQDNRAIKKFLLVYQNIDISKDLLINNFLKAKDKKHLKKKAKVFTKEQIDLFLDNAPDEQFCTIKCAAALGIFGLTRSSEMLALTFEDVEKAVFPSFLNFSINLNL